MSSTDEEKVIHDFLDNNWNTDNATKPNLDYENKVKTHDYRNALIKIYLIDRNYEPHGLGFTSKFHKSRLTIDLRASSRSDVLAQRDEIKRVLDANRNSPATGYELLTYSNERKEAGYKGSYRFTVDCFLTKFRESI